MKKWKLFKTSSDNPSSPSASTISLIPSLFSSSSSRLQSSSASIISATPTRKKTIFGFSTKSDSAHSLLNLTFGSNSETNLLRLARPQTPASQLSTPTPPTPILPAKTAKIDDSTDAKDDEIVTTTIYYHPPKPETETETETEGTLADIDREIEQLNQRKAAIGQLSQARVSDSAISSLRSSLNHGTGDSNSSTHPSRPSPLSGSKRFSAQSDGTRMRSGSMPANSSTCSSSTCTANTPRRRPHEISSLPEEYQQYLQYLQKDHNSPLPPQQQQQQQQQVVFSPAPVPPPKSQGNEPGPSEVIMKLRASVVNMLGPGSFSPSSLVRP
ncbi:hypothetical protein BGZ65_003542, partial [Modicella reniformis]